MEKLRIFGVGVGLVVGRLVGRVIGGLVFGEHLVIETLKSVVFPQTDLQELGTTKT